MAQNLLFHPLIINYILPFVFVFVVTYALMEKINILGDNKQAHLLVALGMAFFFIGVPSLLNVTQTLIPIISLAVIVIFCLMLLFGILGIEFYNPQKSYSGLRGWIAGILIVAVLISFAAISGWTQKFASFLKPEALQFIAFLIVIGVVIWIVTATGGKGGGGVKT